MIPATTSVKYQQPIAEGLSGGETLVEKTTFLFSFRRIHEHLRMTCEDEETVAALVKHLTCIQHAIYAIDCYGEEVWTIDESILRCLWDRLYEKLKRAGASSAEV